MYIELTQDIADILTRLESNGFEAYIVGGCVRDALMGKVPDDTDITTSALPSEIHQVFCDEKLIDTGIKHGTVTLIYNNKEYEITTFRTDGIYADNRHPESVSFVKDIKEDLARRDFTVNAMAYSPLRGLCDLFGGQADIKNKIIRCVGNPSVRFEEDGLRILRALRFSSVLGFEIEKETADSILSERNLLINISSERIQTELVKLIMGENVFEVMDKYREVIAVIIPELVPCFDYDQHTKHHCYDVYRHIIKSISQAPYDRTLRLCMLFHDINKPQSFNPLVRTGHFAGHEIPSAETAVKVMKRLRFDCNTIRDVRKLILEHDKRYPATEKAVKKYISKNGYDFFCNQLKVRKSDTLAQSMYKREEKLQEIELTRQIGEKVIVSSPVLSLSELAVDGNDMKLLCEPEKIGKVLNFLLDAVIDEKVKNQKEELLKYAENIIKEKSVI